MERNILKTAIANKGYKPAQVARLLGFHKTTLYNHIRGCNDLGVKKALKLANLLGITIEDIYATN